MGDAQWQVRIRYREPPYELRHGVVRLYSGTFLIAADSAVEAERSAMRQFRTIEAESGVGWIREVVDVDVRLQVSGAVDAPEATAVEARR